MIMDPAVAELMRRNLFDVFNEPNADRRAAAIAEIYDEDIVWHDVDRSVRGREALAQRAAELRQENPGWTFRSDGPVSVNDDLGHLAFRFGPPDSPPAVTGMDIARCKDGVIIELYTLVTNINRGGADQTRRS
jgi:hypothetical protein